MSADFWAGYISGAAGILIGNPLDLIKVRLQATASPSSSQNNSAASYAREQLFESGSGAGGRRWCSTLAAGTAAPVLGYGALNALLFVAYNRSEAVLARALGRPAKDPGTAWLAGAAGGLATWVVSAPTELIKCRAQLASPPVSSWAITRDVVRREGVRGLYFGGAVTALRDSVGYGFYFWAYELSSQWAEARWRRWVSDAGSTSSQEATKVLLCGGLAGVVTWASVFPLDVIKTRVQTQAFGTAAATPLPGFRASEPPRLGALEVARNAYRQEGLAVFFRGLTVCSVRAFFVNAVQWAAYEWIMRELGQGRHQKEIDT